MPVQHIVEMFSLCDLDAVQRIGQFPLKLLMKLIFLMWERVKICTVTEPSSLTILSGMKSNKMAAAQTV
jgi:hypothetical protein